jgi:hypothetical protein
MSSPTAAPLPNLGLADFAPGLDHIAVSYQNGRIFAISHRNDPTHQHLPNVYLDPSDSHVYVFVHGGQEVTRFENLKVGTHEIPDHVVAQLLVREYGSRLDGMQIRMCTCYGNMLRPGDSRTAVGALAALLPRISFEAYHGLVHIDLTRGPPEIVLGDRLAWDPVSGPYQVGPPGPWEKVTP